MWFGGGGGYCIVLANSSSKEARQPREGVVQKVKEFLG
jgi:hypothetical protein